MMKTCHFKLPNLFDVNNPVLANQNRVQKPIVKISERKLRSYKNRVEIRMNGFVFPQISISEYPEIRYLFSEQEEIETKEQIAEKIFENRNYAKGFCIDDILAIIDIYMDIQRDTVCINHCFYKNKKNTDEVFLYEKKLPSSIAIIKKETKRKVEKLNYTTHNRKVLRRHIETDNKLRYLMSVYYYLLHLDSIDNSKENFE